MMPDADIVALSGSVSNHWSRKSAALIVATPQEVAIERRERAVEREDLQAVLGQLQVADDFRPEQADDVGEHAERVPGDDLVARRRPTQDAALLEDERLPARLREVCGRREAVVAAADDHRVVALRHAGPSLVQYPGVRDRQVPAVRHACAAGRRTGGPPR